MVPLPELLAFVVAAIVIIAIPGPSVLFVIGRALVLGRRGALLSVLGNAAGVALQIIAVAAGLGALVAQSVVLFTVLKIVGAGVLVWLGIQAIRHRHATTDADVTAVSTRPARLLRESFLVGITNPKTIVFFVAALPQFVGPDAGSPTLQMLELGAIFLVLGIAGDSVYAIAAGAARDWFSSNPRRLSGMRASGGVALIGLGGAMAITGSTS
jgi:threonine/homoserine/homoserine lactone efflux protein